MEFRFSEPVDFPVIVKVANLTSTFEPISLLRISGFQKQDPTVLRRVSYPVLINNDNGGRFKISGDIRQYL